MTTSTRGKEVTGYVVLNVHSWDHEYEDVAENLLLSDGFLPMYWSREEAEYENPYSHIREITVYIAEVH